MLKNLFFLRPVGSRLTRAPAVRTDAAMRSLRVMAASKGETEAAVEAELSKGQAMPGFLAPSEICGVYLFLASRDSASMTGQALVASKGEVMH